MLSVSQEHIKVNFIGLKYARKIKKVPSLKGPFSLSNKSQELEG